MLLTWCALTEADTPATSVAHHNSYAAAPVMQRLEIVHWQRMLCVDCTLLRYPVPAML